jgi:hypothetical protein
VLKLILFTLISTSAFAQGLLSFGIKGGVPLTDAFEVAQSGNFGYVQDTKRWTLGPTIQLNLPVGFAVEFNAMYRRLNYNSTDIEQRGVRANSWQFPLLLKYRFGDGSVRPYIAGGGAFQHISDIRQVSHVLGESDNSPELNERNNVGAIIAGGIQLGGGGLSISPEIRYTRWGSENFRDNVRELLHFNQNQAEFLIGITF